MHTALKLSLIALISLVFCPACGQTEAGGTPAADVKATEVTTPEAAPEKAAAPATLDEALTLAKAEGKNVLVEYTSTSCPFCRQMNSQTLARKDVKAALGESVIYFRSVKQTNPAEFEDRWGVQPTPAFVVVDGDGNKLHGPVSGAIPAANFLAYVNWAKTGSGPVPALSSGGS